ncbi:hypothetical protein [Streptomyces roseolus]|nr:hypothetical protein [Streptomyces roseolus]
MTRREERRRPVTVPAPRPTVVVGEAVRRAGSADAPEGVPAE